MSETTGTDYGSHHDYREAVLADVTVGRRVFCYYVGPDPSAETVGTVTTEPDSQGWADVTTDDGRRHSFNADRLGVPRARFGHAEPPAARPQLALTAEEWRHVWLCLTEVKNDRTRDGRIWAEHSTNARVRTAIENLGVNR